MCWTVDIVEKREFLNPLCDIRARQTMPSQAWVCHFCYSFPLMCLLSHPQQSCGVQILTCSGLSHTLCRISFYGWTLAAKLAWPVQPASFYIWARHEWCACSVVAQVQICHHGLLLKLKMVRNWFSWRKCANVLFATLNSTSPRSQKKAAPLATRTLSQWPCKTEAQV